MCFRLWVLFFVFVLASAFLSLLTDERLPQVFSVVEVLLVDDGDALGVGVGAGGVAQFVLGGHVEDFQSPGAYLVEELLHAEVADELVAQ